MTKSWRPPAFSPLPEKEAGICRRVREIRREIGVTQKPFAAFLGVTLDQLKNIEGLRAPIRFEAADAMCSMFRVSQRWLATGEPPQSPYIDAVSGYIRLAEPGTRFSEAYEGFLRKPLEDFFQTQEAFIRGDIGLAKLAKPYGAPDSLPAGFSEEAAIQYIFDNHIARTVSAVAGRMPLRLLIEFHQKLQAFLEEFEDQNEGEMTAFLSAAVNRPPSAAIRIGDIAGENYLAKTTAGRSFSSDENPTIAPMQKTKAVSQRIKEARKKLALSQKQAAAKWGFSAGAIRDWEQERKAPHGLYREKLETILQKIERSA